MYATKYIIDKKFIKYILFSFIAFLFHKMAIIGFFLYFLYKIKIKKNWQFILIGIIPFICYVISSFILKLLSYFYPNYIYSMKVESISFLRMSFELFLLILAFLNRKKIEKVTLCSNILINAQILNVILYALYNIIPYVSRVAMFFSIYQIILVPVLIKTIKFKDIKIVATVFTIAFYLFYLWYSIDYMGSSEVLPYKSILN